MPVPEITVQLTLFQYGRLWIIHEPTREVVPPKRPYLILTTHIPDVELNILVCNGLDVEADSWDGRDVLVQFELVEDRWYGDGQPSSDDSYVRRRLTGLAGRIES